MAHPDTADGERHRLVSAPSSRFQQYRTKVYAFTFIAFANSHFTRKCYSNLKMQILSAGVSLPYMSAMESTFFFFNAVGSFFSGNLGDGYHPPSVIGIGLLGSGLSTLLLTIGFWNNLQNANPIVSNVFFLTVWMFHGLMQSTGGPNNTVIMGNWFGSRNRGYIFGTWTSHQYVGNILSAIVAAAVLQWQSPMFPWMWALLIPSISNICWGVVCITSLPEKPETVQLELPEFERSISMASRRAESTTTAEPMAEADGSMPDPPALPFLEAIQLPNVIGYSLAFGLFKLTNYILFFWLPYFLSERYSSPISGNLLSLLYDVGMIPSGFVVGTLSNVYGGRRACVVASFMILLSIVLMLLSFHSASLSKDAMAVLVCFMGCLVGGPNNIITSAIATELSEHPAVRGNAQALSSLTGLINGIGSIIASLGLLGIGPMRLAYGWKPLWLMVATFSIVGTVLLGPQIRREIRSFRRSEFPMPVASRHRGYESIAPKV